MEENRKELNEKQERKKRKLQKKRLRDNVKAEKETKTTVLKEIMNSSESIKGNYEFK